MKYTVPFFFFFLVLIGLAGCRVQNNPPELLRLSAQKAYIGDPLTLSGYQFGSDPAVTFGVATSAVTAPISSHDDNTIQLMVPLVAPGSTQIRVRNDQGTSDPLPFIVQQPAPAVATVTPSNGLPGTTVVITGNYLNQITRVRFDTLNAIIKDSSAQKLTVVVPPTMPRGVFALAIETKGGNTSNSFIVSGTPQITSISPLRAKPGTELVIQGQNLTDGIVSINGLTTEKALTTVKDTEIRTSIPATATSGLVTVKVFETLVATSTDTLKIIQPPFITNLLAQDGIAGDKLLVNGRNLRDVTSMTVGNVAASFRIISDTQVEVTIPALTASGAVQISASSIGGTATGTDSFFFYLPPTNLVVTPARQLRGRTLTVSGKNLYRITTVSVSGITVPITSRNEGTDLLIGVPDNAVSGSVIVTSRAGTASAPLVVIQAPVVTSILPAKARTGDRIVVTGDFLLNAQIYFSGSTTPAVDGGKNEDTERWILVPSDAQAGPLRVVNVVGELLTSMFFAPVRLATITDFVPKTAKVAYEVTITGQNLASVTAVRFNGGTSTPATFRISGSSLIAIVPADAVTGQICLINEAGTICSTGTITITK
ncbi:IPT/TIG domain-containing protein [Spirosoma foliorum]|uniref:IPT/TIG domain-containing protein n=1 Tax=Spirosoma foliorum TaxID=2710596 RepID=A0A7G5GQI1_9BACT|nr:IPT/TIG domain-containing protein [Spirosoma foliorum]QMW01123.1 IPT/TIG domain-containing protein [Spirosoma foliorum]